MKSLIGRGAKQEKNAKKKLEKIPMSFVIAFSTNHLSSTTKKSGCICITLLA
jgi:hypothetical protein